MPRTRRLCHFPQAKPRKRSWDSFPAQWRGLGLTPAKQVRVSAGRPVSKRSLREENCERSNQFPNKVTNAPSNLQGTKKSLTASDRYVKLYNCIAICQGRYLWLMSDYHIAAKISTLIFWRYKTNTYKSRKRAVFTQKFLFHIGACPRANR